MSGLTEVEAQTSYIIVHALNPEGVEIASIEGMDYYDIEIYDGDTLIGYGSSSAENHNIPIEISSGTHIIKAKFNGMTKEQSVTLNPSETKVLTFTFNRTVFDLINAIESVSTTMNDSFEPTPGGTTFRWSITPTGQYHWDACSSLTPTNVFSSAVSVSVSGDMINISGSGTKPQLYPEPGISIVRIYAPSTGWLGDLYAYKQIDFGAANDFDNWIIQTIYPDLRTNAIVNISEELINPIYQWSFNLTPWALNRFDSEQVGKTYYYFINNKKKYYIEVTAIIREYTNSCLIYDDYYYFTGLGYQNYIHSYDISEKMGLSNVKMSSVPYDLLGTGIHCGGGVEEPPECAFSAKDPVWQNEADEMVLPYDEVDLKFEFTNTAKNAVSNTKVLFLSNSIELMTLEKAIEDIGDVSAGATFTATNRIKIAGTSNSGIMEEIVNVGGSGRLSLKDMIDVQVTADECSAPCEFRLSPTDEKDNILSIQYPDLSDLAGTPVPSDDEDGFYRKQGDIDFHHPSNDLVRKYAVEASAYKYKNNDFVFPDTISEVLENIYYYIIDLIDADMPYPPANDEDITSKINKTIFPKPPYEESHICITHAYLFGSFARTIGIPAREITIALGTSIGRTSQYVFGIFYPAQEAAVQVWYDDAWHLYDTYLEQRSLDGYLYLKRYFAYRAWYSFNRQNTLSFSGSSLKGHNFSIKPLTGSISDGYEYQWKHLHDDIRPGIVIVTNSPVYTYLIDKTGRKTGFFDGQVLQEITESYYLPSGFRTYTDVSDPASFMEADETIFVGGNAGPRDYSLVITGTDDGHYELILAYVHQDGQINGSTIPFDIRKDETHTYDITVSLSGQISITGVPARIDINPNRTPNQVYLSKNYTIYVAVLGNAKFNVADIDSSTVRFGRNGTESKPVRAPTMRDLNADGFKDAMYGFMTFNCGFQLGDTEGVLTGETKNEIKIIGCDSVLVSN